MNPARASILTLLLALLGACSEPELPHAGGSVTDLVRAVGGADSRAHFRQVFCELFDQRPSDRAGFAECAGVLHGGQTADAASPPLPELPAGLEVVIVPGLLGECVADLVLPWQAGRRHLEALGATTHLIEVGGRTGLAHNAGQIVRWFESRPAPVGRVILVGYSKGAIDALEAVRISPRVRQDVDALVAVGGPIGGAPLADQAPRLLRQLLASVALPGCEPAQGQGLRSMTRHERQRWLADWKPPAGVALFSLGAWATERRISRVLRPAWHRLARLDPRNDGQVLIGDTLVPGGELLGFAVADHWALALPFDDRMPVTARLLIEENRYPRALLLEAIVRTVSARLDAFQRTNTR